MERRTETVNWKHKKWVIKPVMNALVSFLIASVFVMLIDGYLIFKLVGLGSYAEYVLLKTRYFILAGLLAEAGLFIFFAFIVALKVADTILGQIERVEREADLIFSDPYMRFYEIKVREGDPLKILIDKINKFVRESCPRKS
ncbi:MAG: hypothetical protein AB1349_07855 [Elusimicrobiota bacterium]